MKSASKMQAPIPLVMKTVLPSAKTKTQDHFLVVKLRTSTLKTRTLPKTINKVLNNTDFDSKKNSLQS